MSTPLRLDRYELLEPIASGGMATVYRGRALGAGGFERLVAIKVMHEHLAVDPDFVTMFLDEARLAANIRHPNVVPTFDVQEDAHGVFIVLEYIEGSSLHGVLRVLRRHGEILPVGVTLRIMFDVLAGLHAAHDLVNMEGRPLGLVHRDVSPQNILVGNDGMGRITDFGIARAESRLTTTRGGQLKGRIAYMSPEVIRSERANRQSDVYAAGVVLWEMLTGESLFVADNDAALMACVLGGPKRTPREVNPEVPWQLDEVCMRALEEPSDRYRTAAAFAEGLERAAEKASTPIAMPRLVASYARRAHAERPRSTAPPPRLRPREASFAGRTQLLAEPPRGGPPPLPMASPFPQTIPPPTAAMPIPPPFPQPAPMPTVSWTPAPGTPVSHTNLSNAAVLLPPVRTPERSSSRLGTVALVAVASLLTGLVVWFVTRAPAATPVAAAPPPVVSLAVPAPAPTPSLAPPAPSASASAAATTSAPPSAEPPPPPKPASVAPAAPRPADAEPAATPKPAAPKPTDDTPPASKPFRPDEL
jgi:serine/threonine protein kinase